MTPQEWWHAKNNVMTTFALSNFNPYPILACTQSPILLQETKQ